ncbi:MAG: septal ring lytic transglycosylase RlpA family protein [Alphaproteobacteria bacterium]
MHARHRFFTAAAIFAGALLLSGCSTTELVSHWVKKLAWPGQQESAGSYKIGNPYRVGSVWYYPHEDFNLVETGIASWYGPDFHGHKTANGEIYDQNEMTAAHRTLQMPSLVRVTNLENGRSVVVRINDRGPYARGRLIDVSKRAAELLGFIGKGTARVRVEVLPKESRDIAEAAKRGTDTSKLALANLDKYDTQTTPQAQPVMAAVPAQPVQVASLDSDSSLPESLQTPTITVEQLSAPGRPARSTQEPQWDEGRNAPYTDRRVISPTERQNFINRLDLKDQSNAVDSTGMVSGRLKKGHFLPDAVVSQERVAPTGIFVQAGAFAVKANADRMKEDFSGLAPVVIEQVTVKGRVLYRVKLGPIANVEKADAILERVISAGNNTAHVIHH